MPKANLKQKLEGNKLDLSLSELKEVPMSDIVSITATIDFYFLNIELSLNGDRRLKFDSQPEWKCMRILQYFDFFVKAA